MKLKLNCREVTRLVLEGEDRALGIGDRLRIRFHMKICVMCPKFVAQVGFMRTAVGRWRAYGNGDDGPPA